MVSNPAGVGANCTWRWMPAISADRLRDGRDVLVPLTGWSSVTAFHCRRTGWNDDDRGAAMLPDRLISRLAIISSIGREPINLTVDLAEQRRHLGRIIRVLVCQPMSNDFATVGIQCQVEFAPVAA